MLVLSDKDVKRCLTPQRAIAAVELAYRELGAGSATNHVRQRSSAPPVTLNVGSAALPALGYTGVLIYTAGGSKGHRVFQLYDAEGALAAVMDYHTISQLRTGASSAVATRYLARQQAARLGVLGSGHQARGQVLALAAERKLASVAAWSPNRAHLESFCSEMSERIGVRVAAAEGPEQAVSAADLVAVATNSVEPVLRGRWLQPGTHVNAVGVNWPHKREIDIDAVRHSQLIVVDELRQAEAMCGDLLQAGALGDEGWRAVVELADIILGRVPGRRSNDQITLFESQGLAVESLAVAVAVYDEARRVGAGESTKAAG